MESCNIPNIIKEAERKFKEFNSRSSLVDFNNSKYEVKKSQFIAQYIFEKYEDSVYDCYINFILDNR